MKEIWTPLKLIGVKFFKTPEGSVFIKVFNKPRKRINKRESVDTENSEKLYL